MIKHLLAMRETWVQSLGREDPLEKEMATHSSILVWKIPWAEEPGRLQSMVSQRDGQDWATEEQHYFLGIINHTFNRPQYSVNVTFICTRKSQTHITCFITITVLLQLSEIELTIFRRSAYTVVGWQVLSEAWGEKMP